jgi:hypothetical protein
MCNLQCEMFNVKCAIPARATGAKLLSASTAPDRRASSLGFALATVGNDSDLARSAFCPLASIG